MSSRRTVQISQEIAHLAGEYFARESNRQSLITITYAESSPDLKNIAIFMTVLPETHEAAALDFAKRSRSGFREYLKEHSRLKFLPTVDFEIDYGEKNRQRIDELTRKKP